MRRSQASVELAAAPELSPSFRHTQMCRVWRVSCSACGRWDWRGRGLVGGIVSASTAHRQGGDCSDKVGSCTEVTEALGAGL